MLKFFKTKYDNITAAIEIGENGEKKPIAIIARVDSAISSGLVKEEAKEYVKNHADNLEEYIK